MRKNKHSLRLLLMSLSFVCLFFLSGCGFITFARVTMNDTITQEDVDFIEPGQTTFSEIVNRLGTPEEMSGSDEEAVIFYHFRDVSYSRINLGWPLRFWTLVQPDFIFSTTGLGTDIFQVTFDRNWVARRRAFTKHVDQAGRYFPWPFRSHPRKN